MTPATPAPQPSAATEPVRYTPGMRVRVTQQIARGSQPLANTVEGTVVRFGQGKTGSWFAHAKDDRLWLDRLELRMDDGELVTLNLDQYSRVEVVDPGTGAADAPRS